MNYYSKLIQATYRNKTMSKLVMGSNKTCGAFGYSIFYIKMRNWSLLTLKFQGHQVGDEALIQLICSLVQSLLFYDTVWHFVYSTWCQGADRTEQRLHFEEKKNKSISKTKDARLSVLGNIAFLSGRDICV